MTASRIQIGFLPYLLAAACGCSGGPKAPTGPPLFKVEGLKRLEILRLQPLDKQGCPDIDNEGADRFHGWKIVGRAMVEGRDQQLELSMHLGQGIAEGDADGVAADCFEPRHGVIAQYEETTIEVIICFACNQADIFRDGKREDHLITNGPRRALDAVLKPNAASRE